MISLVGAISGLGSLVARHSACVVYVIGEMNFRRAVN